jgi:hypothetical protein
VVKRFSPVEFVIAGVAVRIRLEGNLPLGFFKFA